MIAAFIAIAEQFAVLGRLRPHFGSAIAAFILLLGPYWAFGFGAGDWLRNRLISPERRVLGILVLLLPYLVFTVPAGQFRVTVFLGFTAVLLSIAALALSGRDLRPDWRDALILLILALAVELRYFNNAFPVPGLSGLSKLMFVNAGLYTYLVVRPLAGIGFDFRPIANDLSIGLREFLFFTPIAIAIGFGTGFLHFHATLSSPAIFAAAWLFTLFFIALPEELFFRGLMLNMLERYLGTTSALIVSATIFGLAHFNKRAEFFNWRYVILAAIAGIFYGRAWLARRRVLTSSVTHATVDTVWSIWFR